MNDQTDLKIPKSALGQPFRRCVEEAVGDYLDQTRGESIRGLYQFVLAEMEQPLLKTVMRHTGGNQSRASELLGISRGTLRKKLAHYAIDH